MAEVDVVPTFGGDLKDAFKPVNAWVSNGIAWLDDIQQFYRERSVIEKDYSTKLSALAKKYYEKKARKSSSLSVGDNPHLTPGSLESASLTTWSTQLTTVESCAAEHDRFSTELTTRLADPLKNLAAKYEDIRKRHAEYAARLERDRDVSYAELKKVKSNYDNVCQDVESRRKKLESALDHGKQKAQNAYQQQVLDMHNVKNSYLIAINVTNALKEKYYHDYVPELLNNLQDLNETRTARLNSMWAYAAQLEKSTLAKCIESLVFLASKIPRNNPSLDSIMFIRHNAPPWHEPPDFGFEPSPVWHDDAHMVVDETAKVFLRNLMGKSKSQISELKREVDKKRREVDNLKTVRAGIREGKDKRDEGEVVSAMLSMQDELHRIDHKRLTAEVETSTIKSAVGDVTLGARNHNFKSQSFKIPMHCDLCGERIWGLSAKGFECIDCGYTCHSKCSMKVPATCPGEQSKEEKKKLKVERQEACRSATMTTTTSHLTSNGGGPLEGVAEVPALSRSNTMNSLSSGYATSAHRSVARSTLSSAPEEAHEETTSPAPQTPAATKASIINTRRNRVVAPPPDKYISELPAAEVLSNNSLSSISSNQQQMGRMIYAYGANEEGEISVDEGNDVVILEPDDGSGWMKVRAAGGAQDGLVPASYVELTSRRRPQTTTSTSTSTSQQQRPDSTYSNNSSTSASAAGSSTTTTTKKKGPAVAPKKGAKKLHYVEAMYDYEARSDAEWSMQEGDRFVLVATDAGDGWSDVEKGGVVKSVPANYIQDCHDN